MPRRQKVLSVVGTRPNLMKAAPVAAALARRPDEFEHVLEMIEGRNLQRLAREQAPGVWRSVDRMIETSRATDAGRSVLSETQSVDVLDKFVE